MENTQNIYAGFWKRVIASGIDSLTVNLLCAPVTFIFNSLLEIGIDLKPLFLIFSGVIMIIYKCGFESSFWQGTIGKRMMGIKVVDYNFKRIDFFTAQTRNIWQIVFLVLCLVGEVFSMSALLVVWLLILCYYTDCLAAAFTGKKQAWHDMFAKTLVVNDSFEKTNRAPEKKEYIPPADGSFDKDGLTPLMRAVYNEDKEEENFKRKSVPDKQNKPCNGRKRVMDGGGVRQC